MLDFWGPGVSGVKNHAKNKKVCLSGQVQLPESFLLGAEMVEGPWSTLHTARPSQLLRNAKLIFYDPRQ